jgi:integrase/recombinase XerC
MTAELQTPLQDFLQYLEQQRRVSPHTVLNYQRDCQQLVEYCQQQSFTDWQQLKPADIRLFIARLHRKGLGARSIHRLLSAVIVICSKKVWLIIILHNQYRHPKLKSVYRKPLM